MNSPKVNFRYDINALRALAVIAVILYHFKFGILPGGFIGVDIFFVISGFLMTKIIFTSLQTNNFSYFIFLRQRVYRLVPALVSMVFIVTAIELLLYFPWNVKESAKSGLASLLFISNIKYSRHSGYFDPASAYNIYLHTWSLSVEFQFYLIYPFLLIGLKSIFKKTGYMIMALLILALFSFGYSIWLSSFNSDASFYLLPSRSWELLMGGLAFFLKTQKFNLKTRVSAAIFSYTLLVFCVLTITQEMKWPGYYTLIPVLATLTIIMADIDLSILKAWPVQLIGRISYSLYLWHWPVYLIAEYVGIPMLIPFKILQVLISGGLAYTSFTLIENNKINSLKLSVLYLMVFTGVLICNNFSLNEFLFNIKTLEIANYKLTHEAERGAQFSDGKCFNSKSSLYNYKKSLCLQFTGNKKNILLIGDSHAAELSQSLRNFLASKNITLLQATESGCLPLLSEKNEVYCKEMINFIYKDFIVHNASRIDGVILTGNWVDSPDKESLIINLDKTISYLKKYKLKTILVGQTELYSIPYAEIVAREFQYHVKIRDRYIDNEGMIFNEILAKHFSGNYINIYNEGSVPPLKYNKIPYLFDLNHLTKYGADLAVLKIYGNPISHKFLFN